MSGADSVLTTEPDIPASRRLHRLSRRLAPEARRAGGSPPERPGPASPTVAVRALKRALGASGDPS